MMLNTQKKNMSLTYEVRRYTGLKSLYYTIHNLIHRLEGPSVIIENGTRRWSQYDKNHRIGGPSYVFSHGATHYYIRGIPYTKIEYDTKIRNIL